MVRLPQNKIGSYNRANRASLGFMQEYEREPSIEELAEMTDMTENELEIILASSNRHESLDAPVHESADETLIDTLHGDEETDHLTERSDLRHDLIVSMKMRLSKRDVFIMKMHFGLDREPMSYKDIGDLPEIDLSTERVRQVVERAKERLRRSKAVIGLLKKYRG